MSSLTTKKAIAFAFKQLLTEKPFNHISVNEIASKCDINRQTFYYHFTDIYDLVEWICLEDADKALANNKTYDTWQLGFLAIFELLKKDEVFIKNIYKNVSLELLINYLYKLVYPLIYGVVEEKAQGLHVSDDDKEFIANFYKSAFVALVLDWIKNNLKDDPKMIISRLSVLIEGTVLNALKNFSK